MKNSLALILADLLSGAATTPYSIAIAAETEGSAVAFLLQPERQFRDRAYQRGRHQREKLNQSRSRRRSKSWQAKRKWAASLSEAASSHGSSRLRQKESKSASS